MPKNQHLFITGNATAEKFKTPRSGGDSSLIPKRSRVTHSRKLLRQFQEIWDEKEALREERTAESIPSGQGTYVQFTSTQGYDLITKSLESLSQGIRLLNVQEQILDDGKKRIKALVYIPRGKERYFVSKIEKYRTENIKNSDTPKNSKLVDSIEDVSLALLESLWTDKISLVPGRERKWCEAWLNISSDNLDDDLETFSKTLAGLGIDAKPNSILFPERAVLLINANKDELIELMLRSDLLAELRAGQEAASYWMNETSVDQQKWVQDLLQRLQIEDGSNIKVCILDKGVNSAHQLLQPILSNDDMLTVDPTWGTNDHHPWRGGHGTLMAGLIGYGQFEDLMVGQGSVLVTHKLCSIKILPPPNQEGTPRELWGDITAQGVAKAEINNPEKILLFCMAVTSKEDTNMGRPSSWSGAVDNLAYGDGDSQRLIIISAGNLNSDEAGFNYPESNFVSSVQNPAQAWNCLTIGAYTKKILVRDTQFSDHTPVANEGQLSPHSTTSLSWEKRWPTKPDVVFEGGNLLKAPDQSITGHYDLELLSTSKDFNVRAFDTIFATSAASAQAAWLTAKVAYLYPNAWPETLRGLVIHSASWTPEMLAQMDVRPPGRANYSNLLKVFGYGAPDLEKALYDTDSAFTYISEETIQPFGFKAEEGKITTTPETNEIHYYNLPWPKDLLLSLENIPVKLKITLSYFVEPGPGAIGWKDKYRYASHGLRFDLNSVGETFEDFKRRINAEAREENKGQFVSGNSGSERWVLGFNNRSNGSVHSDTQLGGMVEVLYRLTDAVSVAI